MNEVVVNFDKLFWSTDSKAPIDVGEIVGAHIGQVQAVYETAVENMDSYGEAIDMAINKHQGLAREQPILGGDSPFFSATG